MSSVVREIARKLVAAERQDGCYAAEIKHVVAVSGAAALGKTRFCRDLERYFRKRGMSTIHLELDGYLKDRSKRRSEGISGYDPRATLFSSLLIDLDAVLLKGESRAIPYYDYKVGRVTKTVLAVPQPVVILDGIISMHHELRDRYPSYHVFFEADDLVMKGLRVKVDMRERGYSIFEALKHIDTESKGVRSLDPSPKRVR